MPIPSTGCDLYFCQTRGSHEPLLGFNNLLERLPGLGEMPYLGLPVSYKGYDQEQPDGREAQGKGQGWAAV